jgi:primosomal protein N' (replication factor Y)
VIGADSLFHWPDFRARERALSVLMQVSGRTARGQKPGKVIIQTYDPKHPVLQTLMGKVTKADFLTEELGLREGLNYPPFSKLLRIHCESKDFPTVSGFIQKMADELRRTDSAMGGNLQVLGPVPSFIERVEQKHRFEIMLKSKEVPLLQKIGAIALERIQEEKSIDGFLDQDPSSF